MIKTVEEADYLIADKGYDAETIRRLIKNKKMILIIPMRSNSKRLNKEFDKHLYRLRHLIENTFVRLKHFRAIATWFDKVARNYQSMIYIACMFIWCKAKWGHALIKLWKFFVNCIYIPKNLFIKLILKLMTPIISFHDRCFFFYANWRVIQQFDGVKL